MAAGGRLDEALTLVESGRIPVGFEAAFADLRGDIYREKGELEKASAAYSEALELAQNDFQLRSSVQTKLDDLNTELN